jgi:hypothetical protein
MDRHTHQHPAINQGRGNDRCRIASVAAMRGLLLPLLLLAIAAVSFLFVRWVLAHLEPVHIPSVVMAGQLAILLAGIIIGLKLRDWLDATLARAARREADDTHAAFPPETPAPPPPTRRVRAGPPPLPYSYDSRKSARH